MDTKQPEALRLAPCPFCCGGARRTTVGTNAWFGTGCDGDQSCPAHLRALTHKTQAEADAAWNRRTPPAAAELLRLRAENDAAMLEIESLHAENTLLQSGYDAARMEIASLHERLEYSKKANDNWAAKTHALEAKNIGLLHALTAEQDENHALHQQLAAIGAGGVEPLRKREFLHQIDEQAQIYSDVQRDAERYRWLRKQHWNEGVLCVVMQPKKSVKLGCDCPSLDRLDGFIDAAIAAQGGV